MSDEDFVAATYVARRKRRSKELKKQFGPAVGSTKKFARAAMKVAKQEMQQLRDEKHQLRHEMFGAFMKRSGAFFTGKYNDACEFGHGIKFCFSLLAGMKGLTESLRRHVKKVKSKVTFAATLTAAQWATQRPTLITAVAEVIKILDITTDGFLSATSGNILANIVQLIKDSNFIAQIADATDYVKNKTTQVLLGREEKEEEEMVKVTIGTETIDVPRREFDEMRAFLGYRKLATIEEEVYPPRHEMGGDPTDSLIAGVAAFISSVLIGKAVQASETAKAVLKTAGNTGRDFANTCRGFDVARNLVEKLIACIRGYLERWSDERTLKDEAVPGMDLSTLVNQTHELIKLVPGPDIGIIQLKEKVNYLQTSFNTLRLKRLHGGLKLSADASRIIESVERSFVAYQTEHVQALRSTADGRKRTPALFDFFGEAGCGKSEMVNQFARDLTHESITQGIAWDTNNLVYSQNPNTKHMDGYRQQNIHIQDDAMQGEGYSPETSEALELIRTVSPVEMPVVMASLADKGMLYASYLILRTTNVPFPKPKEVACKQALWRRRTRLIEVVRCTKEEGSCICHTYPGVRGRKHFNLVDPLGGVKIGSTVIPETPARNYIKDPKWGTCKELNYYQLLQIVGNDLTKWWSEDPSGKPFLPLDEDQIQAQGFKNQANRYEMKQEEMDEHWPRKEDIFVYTSDTLASKTAGGRPYFIEEPKHLMSTNRVCCLRPFEFTGSLALNKHESKWDMSVCRKELMIYDKDENHSFRYGIQIGEMTPTQYLIYKTAVKNGLISYYRSDAVPNRLKRTSELAEAYYDTNDMDNMIKHGHVVLMAMEVDRRRLARFRSNGDCADAHCKGRRVFNGEISYANQMLFAGEYKGPCVARHNVKRLSDRAERLEIVGEIGANDEFGISGPLLVTNKVISPKLRYDPETEELLPRHEMGPSMLWAQESDEIVPESDSDSEVTASNEDLFGWQADQIKRNFQTEMSRTRFRVKVVLYCLGAISAALVAYGVYKAFEMYSSEPLQHQFVSGDPTTNKTKLTRVHRHEYGQQNVGDVVEKVKQNMCEIVIFLLDEQGECVVKPFKGSSLGLFGHALCVNSHAFWLHTGWTSVNFLVTRKKTGAQSRFTLTKDEITYNRAADLTILQLPVSAEAFKDIRKYFIVDAQLPLLTRGQSVLVSKDDEKHVAFDRLDKLVVKDGHDNSIHTYVDSFRYPVLSEVGMCGSALVVTDLKDGGNRFIAGLHNVGNGHKGYSRPVTQELITELTADMRFEMECIDDEDLMYMLSGLPGVPKVKTGGSVDYVGIAGKEFEQGPARKTNIRPSCLHGELGEVTTAPAVFSLRQSGVSQEAKEAGVSPYDAGLLKFSKPVLALPHAALQMAVLTVMSVLKKMPPVPGIEKKILTEDEMINGTECGYIPAMDLDTSPGLPWKNYKPALAKGKRFMFDVKWEANEKRYAKLRDELVLKGVHVGEQFRNNLEMMEKRLLESKEVVIVIYENLKDERRKLKHIANAKTRVFDVSPMEFNMLLRKYFGAFNAAMQKKCTEMPVAVGIDFNGPDAMELYDRLTRLGTDCIAGDFESWDGCLPDELLMKYADLANGWYDDEFGHVRRGLIRSIIHSVLVSLNTVARKHQGLPSGIAVTAPMNSVVNWVLQLTAIIDILESNRQIPTMAQLIENVELTFWGDDHLVVPSPEIKEWINFMTMKTWFKKYGFGYTDAEKSGKEFEFENIHDVLYCKRKFRRDALGVITMPTELSVLTESIQWRRETPGVSEKTSYEATMKNYVESLSMHGEEIYDREIARVNAAIRRVNEERMTTDQLDQIEEPYRVWRQRRAIQYGLY